jgi:hypothetical protein
VSSDTKQHCEGSGYTVVKAGGVAMQTFEDGEITLVGTDSDAALELTSDNSEFQANPTEFILIGNATLNGVPISDDEKVYLIGISYGNAINMTIKENGVLTIASGTTFTVQNTTLTIGTGATLVGEDANSKIKIGGGDPATQITGATNFYNGSNIDATPVAGETYTWNTDKWDRS